MMVHSNFLGFRKKVHNWKVSSRLDTESLKLVQFIVATF